MKFSSIFDFQKKSKVKAGDGKQSGTYPFYTSSPIQKKFLDDFQYEDESLIFGTGGNASLHYSARRFSVSTDCLVAQLRENQRGNFSVKYIFYFLNGNINLLQNGFKGAGLKHISKSYIDDIDIPEMNISHQLDIVDRLDKLMYVKHKRLESYKQLDKYPNVLFTSMFGDPMQDTNKWVNKTLSEICTRLSDGPFGSNLKSSHYVDEGVRVIRLKNIGIGKFIDKDKAYISKEYHESTLLKFTCKPGDIIIATLGDPNIRACILPESVGVSINKADCIHCVPINDLVKPEYLVSLLNHQRFQHKFNSLAHGQTRSRVSSGQLKTISIPLPPIKLQNEFAQILNRVENIKQTMLEQQKQLDNQFNALIQKAFQAD